MGWTFGDNVFYDTTIKQLLHNTLPYTEEYFGQVGRENQLSVNSVSPNVILETSQTAKKMKVDPYVVVLLSKVELLCWRYI